MRESDLTAHLCGESKRCNPLQMSKLEILGLNQEAYEQSIEDEKTRAHGKKRALRRSTCRYCEATNLTFVAEGVQAASAERCYEDL